MADPEETFSDEESRRSIERAAERQEAVERARLASGQRVSLADLKAIAGEVGIDPSHVQAAAREMVLRREGAPPAGLLGIPPEIAETRMLPGTVSDGQWERMVLRLRDAFGRTGLISPFGEVREWASAADAEGVDPVRVRLEPSEDGTLLSIRQSTGALRGVSVVVPLVFGVLALVFGVLLVLGVLPSKAAVLPILLGSFAGVGLAGGLIGGRIWSPRQAEKFRRVADEVELIGRPQE